MNKRTTRWRKRISTDWIVGKTVFAIYTIIAITFLISFYLLQLLPMKLMIVPVIPIALADGYIYFLTRKPQKRVQYITGLTLALFLIVILIIGNFYAIRTYQTAQVITTSKFETTVVGIYVRADDENDFSQVAGSYLYGILAEQDRENTNEVVNQIEDEYNLSIWTIEYGVLTELIDAVLAEQIDAIIINSAYVDLLDDIEGYEEASQQLREVKIIHIEREIEFPVEDETETQVPYESADEEGLLSGTVDTENADMSEIADDGLIFTVYLSGIDNRGALIEKSRCDTNILASVNTATKQVVMISTPRDFYVPLSIADGAMDKLTHAGIYGVNVSMDTLSILYNVNIDYYFRVNFAGFENIVDALGGVTVNSEVVFDVDDYSFVEGPNDVDGRGALLFCRVRTAFASGDRQRGRNQLSMMRAIIDKAMSPELLLNYDTILKACEESFETSIPYDIISKIVRDQLDHGGDWNIVTYSVNGEGAGRTPYSTGVHSYVMIPYQDTVDTAKNLIWQVYTGQTVAEPS